MIFIDGNILLHPYFFPTFSPKMGISGEKSIEKPLIHYESAVYYLRVVEVTAMLPSPAITCILMKSPLAALFFFANLRRFEVKTVKIAYFLRNFKDFVV